LASIIQKFGIEITFLPDLNNLERLKENIKANTKMIWIETPSNPLLHITDIKALSEFTKALNANILLVADNTFLSPYFQKPLELGCDLVIHSTTKYINGHSDVIGGVVVSKTEALGTEIANYVNCLGLACSPFDAWLVLRGLKTLPQRMEAHQKNALKLAEFLGKQTVVKKVFYTGLPSHPQFELIKKQMSGFGGMLSFELDTDKVNLNKFFQSLKYFSLAVSLGGVESLIAQPWSMSHASMPEKARIEAGLSPAIIRVSAGIENSEDLISDLKTALEACCSCC
jgi:cystathionine beta-lyase/cystathionine gamma-synthase